MRHQPICYRCAHFEDFDACIAAQQRASRIRDEPGGCKLIERELRREEAAMGESHQARASRILAKAKKHAREAQRGV